MVNASLVTYEIRTFTLGSVFGSDMLFSNPAKAVYVPSEQVLVRTDSSSGLICGPLYKMYEVLVGENAQKAYDDLLVRLKSATPQQIEVPDSFVTWARSLHEVRNPSKEISDILSPY